MDSSVAVNSPAIEQWVAQWERCLELWMESGAASPGPTAVNALNDWLTHCPPSGWEEVREAAARLQSVGASDSDKADALLDLITWQRTAQRVLEARACESF